MIVCDITPGPGINIIGTGSGTPWVDMSRPSAGMVRFNNVFEVYDGSNWIQLRGSYPSVELDASAQAAIRWANAKMAEEQRLDDLAKNNPTLQDALDALKRAQEQVRIVAALVQE